MKKVMKGRIAAMVMLAMLALSGCAGNAGNPQKTAIPTPSPAAANEAYYGKYVITKDEYKSQDKRYKISNDYPQDKYFLEILDETKAVFMYDGQQYDVEYTIHPEGPALTFTHEDETWLFLITDSDHLMDQNVYYTKTSAIPAEPEASAAPTPAQEPLNEKK